MITEKQLSNLKNGDKISYGLFTNISFIDCDGRYATMRDKSGNEKVVYKKLFMRYCEIAKNDIG